MLDKKGVNMGRFFSNFKVCQTCRYWTGARKIDGISKIVESISDTGKCINRNSFYNHDMNKTACCSRHEPIV